MNTTQRTAPSARTHAPAPAPAGAASNREAVISASNLVRTYAGKKKKQDYTAVRGISFDVYEGEVFGLLGTNGAGKTSTLEVLEGLASPTSGTVSVLGKDPVKNRGEVRRHTGIMLQSGGLPSQLTVLETITMWRGTCSSPLPAMEVLEAVDLGHRTSVKVGSLSGGEQRRLDLACALVGNPSIVYLDEPTTGLDPESRRNVWALLKELKRRGVTMILTTHYLEEAEVLCDRIAIMHEGEIALEGTLGELVGTANAEISFAWPTATGMPQLPDLPGALVNHGDGEITIATQQLQGHAFEVLSWARSHGLELEDFAARPATLETVFLRVAGHDPSL